MSGKSSLQNVASEIFQMMLGRDGLGAFEYDSYAYRDVIREKAETYGHDLGVLKKFVYDYLHKTRIQIWEESQALSKAEGDS